MRYVIYKKWEQPLSDWAVLTKYHKWDGVWTTENYSSQFGKLGVWDQDASMVGFWWGPSFSVLLYPYVAESQRSKLFQTLTQALIPFMRASLLCTHLIIITSQGLPFLITFGVGFKHLNWWRGTKYLVHSWPLWILYRDLCDVGSIF